MTPKTQLGKALQTGLRPDGNLTQVVRARGDTALTIDEAHDVCAVLAETHDAAPLQGQPSTPAADAPLHQLAMLFQMIDQREVAVILQTSGIPHLVRLYDSSLSLPQRNTTALLFILKILAMHDRGELVERLTAAVQDTAMCEGPLWSVLFRCLGEDSFMGPQIAANLRRSLPLGFAAVAFLDYANVLCIAERIGQHPFDTPEGRRRLRDWITLSDPKYLSYAASATVALPFLTPPEREEMLGLAQMHAFEQIRLEAAWAAARLGHEDGVRTLAEFCLDPKTSRLATAYLTDLGRSDAVPEEAQQSQQ